MPCKSIADVLRGLGEIPPSERALIKDAVPEPPVSRWVDPARIAVANSRDFRERLERGTDDRPIEERRAHASRAHACAVAKLPRGPRYTFGAKVKNAERVIFRASPQ
jgi:hypothetical protein